MRKFIIIAALFMLLLIIMSIFFALREKYLEIKINKINKEINKSYGELQSLKAEWGYLNNKEYLKFLVDKYLPEMILQPKIK